jgi:hypothetical protein
MPSLQQHGNQARGGLAEKSRPRQLQTEALAYLGLSRKHCWQETIANRSLGLLGAERETLLARDNCKPKPWLTWGWAGNTAGKRILNAQIEERIKNRSLARDNRRTNQKSQREKSSRESYRGKTSTLAVCTWQQKRNLQSLLNPQARRRLRQQKMHPAPKSRSGAENDGRAGAGDQEISDLGVRAKSKLELRTTHETGKWNPTSTPDAGTQNANQCQAELSCEWKNVH